MRYAHANGATSVDRLHRPTGKRREPGNVDGAGGDAPARARRVCRRGDHPRCRWLVRRRVLDPIGHQRDRWRWRAFDVPNDDQRRHQRQSQRVHARETRFCACGPKNHANAATAAKNDGLTRAALVKRSSGLVFCRTRGFADAHEVRVRIPFARNGIRRRRVQGAARARRRWCGRGRARARTRRRTIRSSWRRRRRASAAR